MALCSLGSTHISHLLILLSISRKIYQIHFHFIKVFHKALFYVLFFSFSTPLHSAHLYLIHLSNIISIPMTLNSVSLFTPSTSRLLPPDLTILKSLHWLEIDQHIQYKVLSLTYKTFNLKNLPISTAFSTCNLTL